MDYKNKWLELEAVNQRLIEYKKFTPIKTYKEVFSSKIIAVAICFILYLFYNVFIGSILGFGFEIMFVPLLMIIFADIVVTAEDFHHSNKKSIYLFLNELFECNKDIDVRDANAVNSAVEFKVSELTKNFNLLKDELNCLDAYKCGVDLLGNINETKFINKELGELAKNLLGLEIKIGVINKDSHHNFVKMLSNQNPIKNFSSEVQVS